jgi:anti-sigma B factor antagonist
MTQTASFSPDRVCEIAQILTLDGECDLPAAVEAEQWIAEALAAGTAEIVVDLRGVRSLDATMLQVLLRGLMLAKMQRASFVLVRPNAYVWTQFEQRGLDRVFSSFPDLERSLAKAEVRSR